MKKKAHQKAEVSHDFCMMIMSHYLLQTFNIYVFKILCKNCSCICKTMDECLHQLQLTDTRCEANLQDSRDKSALAINVDR